MANSEKNTDDGLVFGKNPVIEILKSGAQVDSVYISTDDEKIASYIISLAKQKNAVVKRIHPNKLEKMCGSDRHQGVAARCSLCSYCELDDIFNAAELEGKPPFIAICDGVEDPHNLGAIIRTCECAGVHGVVIPERRGCGITPAVVRASAGACGHVKIHRAKNLASCIDEIKKRGVFCYYADMDGVCCYDADLTGAVALVIGSEGFGPSRLVKQKCDGVVSLPLKGKINSLNASVAAGIVIYETVRQMRGREVEK